MHVRPAFLPLGVCVLAVLAGCPTPDPDPTDTDVDTETEEPTCVDGSEPLAFLPEEGGVLFGDVAGDFSVELLDGSTWTFSEQFSGCDSYVFVVYRRGYGKSSEIFERSNIGLLADGADNVHYIVMSDEETLGERKARAEFVQDQLDSFGNKDLASRVHVSVDSPFESGGGLEEMFRDYHAWTLSPANAADLGDRGKVRAPPLTFFGIDRGQRWDSGGSTSDFVGGPSSYRTAARLGGFYNHRHEIAKQVEATPSDEVVFVDEEITERVFTRTITLPKERTSYDTLELDVEVVCNERNPFNCSEWDRIAHISVCMDGEECTQRRELVRWITPYWRRGQRRWVMDASPLLPLLPESGDATLHVSMGPRWERATKRTVRMAARFRNEGGPIPTGVQFAYRGGTFNDTYNDRESKLFTPPASAKRVEVVYMLSGHGHVGNANCAEWCDHRHTFAVNEADLPVVKHEGGIGGQNPWGCGDLSSAGVSPGQWGNWSQMRAYWCPGLPVPVERIDITSKVELGAENALDYRGSFGTGQPKGGDISLSSYVVWYE